MAALTISLVAGVAVSLTTAGTGLGATESFPARSDAASGYRMAELRAGAQEFGVPVRLLLAISYNQSRWERQGGAASVDGGFGLMDLAAKTFPAGDARGDPARIARRNGAVGDCWVSRSRRWKPASGRTSVAQLRCWPSTPDPLLAGPSLHH
jgi:hypothetical protein